ncbi:MAG: ABC transporter substrate-binding protein [Candidatus Paceibacterota bacterium]|jgi:ABC-type nitrate/sulfonate/bicarbonate transport system substrate-binding protein/outer membrane protein OmpA-like peptidoglycan-associated protein
MLQKRNRTQWFITIAVMILSFGVSFGDVSYLSLDPLSKTVVAKSSPVASQDVINLPLITWGGDIATVYAARKGGEFEAEGLKVNLQTENDFRKQVENFISGKTPFLRGTMGMVNAAVEACEQAGVRLVVVHQMTWSVGGDTIVVRDGDRVRQAKDLRGKTIALQRYGPHMDYLVKILSDAGVKISEVKLKWLRELTLPIGYSDPEIIDPVSAFKADSSLDAVMCIIPDASALTSGGKVGTGSEGSVKGARILLTTKTASRVIADTYAVREDYFQANREQVQKLVHALLLAQEGFANLVKNKAGQQAVYRQIIGEAAKLIIEGDYASTEAMIGDCELVGHNGNVAFFTGQGTMRNFQNMTSEIQNWFIDMGLLSKRVDLLCAEWDWNDLAKGLTNVGVAPVVKAQFDNAKLTTAIENKIAAEATSWDQDILFDNEINFDPNEREFAEAKYAEDFKKALGFVQTYGGAMLAIEGHSDPLQILKDRQAGVDQKAIAQKEQIAKNLSVERARAVRLSFINFCRSHKYTLDETRLVAVGRGIESPKFSPPKTKAEWAANRRVRFLIKNVEAEAAEFTPLGQ